mgnify:FL=1
MFRSLFSLCALLMAVGTVILLHSAAIMDACPVSEEAFGLAYANAVVWMALFLFLCLPLLRSIAKLVYVNALPALVGTVSAVIVLYAAHAVAEECKNSKHNLLLTSLGNVALALVLLVSEVGCPRKADYAELK